MSDTAQLTRTEQVESVVARCCWNAAAILRVADCGERNAERRKRLQKSNERQADLLGGAAEIADDMLAALKAAQEALFWYKAEQFETGGMKVGEQVSAAIALAEGRTP